MDAEPLVSVVIPSWNCAEDLRRCLRSLEEQCEVEVEVFVVDNGSTDGTVEMLRDGGVPHRALSENTGFAAAVNLGLASTSAPYVMVLNEDTVVEPTALSRLLRALLGESDLGGVQPLILEMEQGAPGRRDDPDAIVYSHGQSLTRDGRAREDGAGTPQALAPIARREIFGVCGAACLLRREMLDGLGGYDERYFAFYEDVDLNVRARIAGWRFRLEPAAVVWHTGHAAWTTGFARPASENARLVARNRMATQLKFMPFRSLPRIAAVEAASLVQAVRERRLRATVSGKVEAVGWLRAMRGDRSQLRRHGELESARRWLGVGWAQGKAGQALPRPEPARRAPVPIPGAGRAVPVRAEPQRPERPIPDRPPSSG
jgi:GT2 family glycosyltransferase